MAEEVIVGSIVGAAGADHAEKKRLLRIDSAGRLEPGGDFGKTTLAAVNNSIARWVRGETSPLDQKGATGWLANLYGGAQTGDDWARVNVPVNELPVTSLTEAMWSYYMAQAQTMGVNIVICVHNPANFDARAEITQLANVAGLEKGAGWNAHKLVLTTDQFFWYGENCTGTALTEGVPNYYGWDDFQADVLFRGWTIYRITLEYGWEASGTFDNTYVADIKLNGQLILLEPCVEELEAEPTTPVPYNITCTDANTEYSQALPANCKRIEFQARTEAVVRYAFATEKVATPTAPYFTLKAGDYYYSPKIKQGVTPSTLYVASATAGTVVELLAWT